MRRLNCPLRLYLLHLSFNLKIDVAAKDGSEAAAQLLPSSSDVSISHGSSSRPASPSQTIMPVCRLTDRLVKQRLRVSVASAQLDSAARPWSTRSRRLVLQIAPVDRGKEDY